MEPLRYRLLEGELPIPARGSVRESGRRHPAWVLVDDDDQEVGAVAGYLRELALSDVRPGTQRTYAYGLQRWFRLLWMLEVDWDRATRTEVEVLVGWLRSVDNPQRKRTRLSTGNPGGVNSKTGKPYLEPGYSNSYIDNILAAISGFYDFHAENHRGPVVSPVPANRERSDSYRHRSPIEPRRQYRRAPLRQRRAQRSPRAMSDAQYDEFLASMGCERDRALVLMFVSSGARATELLGVRLGDINWAEMRFSVISKGTRLREEVPASPEAFRALAHYLDTVLPIPEGEPIWRTRRGPDRPLTYSAMRRILQRANDRLETNWTAHDFRHTLAMRLSRDEAFKTEEIQKILRHANLSTTGIYQRTQLDDVIDKLADHYTRPRVARSLAAGFDPDDMSVVFGG